MTLVYLTVAWTAGILVSYFASARGLIPCSMPTALFLLLSGAPAAEALLLRKRRLALLGVLGVFFFLGAWRYHIQPFAPCLASDDLAFHHVDRADGIDARITGIIVDYPEVRDGKVQYHVAASELHFRGTRWDVWGDVLVEGSRFPVYAYGDRIEAAGRLLTPPVSQDFDYRRYLAQRGIHSLMRRAAVTFISASEDNSLRGRLYAARSRFAVILNRIFPEPAAALANGMLLGIESGIAAPLDEAFKATGASHVIVISGSNIALFSGLLMTWATRVVGRRRAALPVLGIIAAYVILIGADAAAFRAGVMGGLVVLAAYFGRQSTGYVSLCAAAMILTAVNPLILWDLGFQLSFLATLGLILFTQPFNRALEALLQRFKAPRASSTLGSLLRGTLVVTIAAQVMTAPLLLASFGRFSPVSLVVNALIVPVQPVILLGGFAALAAGVVWTPLGRLVALVPWLFLKYTVAVVEAAARLPFASIDAGGNGSLWAWLSVGIMLLVAAIWLGRRS